MKNKHGYPVGTGFVLEYKGRTLAVTNDHICDLQEDAAQATYTLNGKERILALKKTHVKSPADLCLLEIQTEHSIKGLQLASRYELGEEVMAVGHPAVMPFTLSKGQLIGLHKSNTLLALILSKEDHDYCINKTGTVAVVIQGMVVCIRVSESLHTTVHGLGGSIGSPTVNFFGNVVGVIYAGNDAGWMIAVPKEDLVEMLESYLRSLEAQ